MILPSPEMVLAVAAALIALWCAVTVMACRARSARSESEFEAALERCRLECREAVANAVRESERSAPEIAVVEPIQDMGRLNRSARARALKLLRTGVPPDSAAATLEMPKKDVALLARVGAVLAQ
jgi:hypothetical protein